MTKYVVCATMLLLAALPAAAIDVTLINTDPAPVIAGDYADVTLRFTKDSEEGEATARFFIEERELLFPVSERELTLRFRPGDVVTHTFRLYFSDKLPQGYIDLPAVIEEEGGEQNADVRIFVQEAESDPELHVGSVETVPDELLPDTDDNEVTVTLQNLGDKDAELVSAELRPLSAAVTEAHAYSLLDSVAAVEAGGEAELAFSLDLEEEARDDIPMELQLRYRAQRSSGLNYETFEETMPLVLPVTAAPFLEVVDVEQLDAFAAGTTENRVRVTLQNSGEEDAEEVRVRALPDISYPLIFELTTEYVASKIMPGENASVEYKVEVVGDAEARAYPVTLRLESLVGEARYSQDDTMTVTVRPGRDLSPVTLGATILAIAAVASIWLGIVVWRKRRKRRKR